VHAPAARVNRRPSARELKQPGPELAGQETIKHSTLRALRRAQNKRHPRAAGAAVCPREAPVKSFFRLFCTLAPLVSAAFGQGNVVKTPAVRAQMSKLYANARQSFVPTTNGLTRKTELSFTLSADGAPNQVASSHDWTHDSVRVHRGDTAIVHTHPFATSPRPSDGDVAIAVKLGIPNYVLSYYALWVAMPDGGVEQVADVQWRHGQLVLKQRDRSRRIWPSRVRTPPPECLDIRSDFAGGCIHTTLSSSLSHAAPSICGRNAGQLPSSEARNEGRSGVSLRGMNSRRSSDWIFVR
jgi:hypothetical protein